MGHIEDESKIRLGYEPDFASAWLMSGLLETKKDFLGDRWTVRSTPVLSEVIGANDGLPQSRD